MRINNFIFFLCFIFLTSCQNDTKYHSYNSTSPDGWKKSDMLRYYIPDSLEHGIYRMEIGIRHTGMYKYKNLWIEVKSNLADAKNMRCDSIQIILADKAGNWLGKGISRLYQKDSLLTKRFVATDNKKAKIYVRHIMRDKNLPGIRDVGIRLIKESN